MKYKLLIWLSLSIILLNGSILKIDKLVVKSIVIDSARGMSFKNMKIMFSKKKDGNAIIKGTFNDPKYTFSYCKPANASLDCLNIRDLSYDSNRKEKQQYEEKKEERAA